MSDSKKKKKKKRKKEITLNDDDKDDNDDANKFNLTAAGSVVTAGVVSATETITKSSFGSVGPKNIIRMKKKEEKNRIQFSPPLIIEDDNISQKKMKNAVVPNNSNCDSNSNGIVQHSTARPRSPMASRSSAPLSRSTGGDHGGASSTML